MADTTVPVEQESSALLERAKLIFEEIANQANRLDQRCHYTHGDLIEETWQEPNPDRIEMELTSLREAICRLGHLADFGSSELNGSVVRGETRAWLLPPVYPGN